MQRLKHSVQKTLDGAETWEGVCCKECWYATWEKCVCRCGGANHGKGLLSKEKPKEEA